MKTIKEVQKIYTEELPCLEEKLYALANEIHEELESFTKSNNQNIQVSLIRDFMAQLEPQLRKIIKRDSTFILPYIKNITELFENGEEKEALHHFHNLKRPIADLIKSQNELMDHLNLLRKETKNFNLFFVRDPKLRQLIIRLFDLYQTFEKYLFVEENLLLTGLAHLTEESNLEQNQQHKN